MKLPLLLLGWPGTLPLRPTFVVSNPPSNPSPLAHRSYSTSRTSSIMSSQKVIILTGASRGIGLAIAKYLLGEGHRVVLVARTAGPLEKLREEYGALVQVFVGDVSQFGVRMIYR